MSRREILIDCSIASPRGNRNIDIILDRPLAFDFSSNRSTDIDGRLHVKDSIISSAVLSPYAGREIPEAAELGLSAETVYYLYRDADALRASVESFENLPLMDDHIATSAASPQTQQIVGVVSNVRFKAPNLIADLGIWDGGAIARVQDGSQRGISCGYRFRCVRQPGTVDGKKFEFRMVDIIGNHVALVNVPRIENAFVADFLPQFRTANVLDQIQTERDRVQRERENSPLARLIPGYYRL